MNQPFGQHSSVNLYVVDSHFLQYKIQVSFFQSVHYMFWRRKWQPTPVFWSGEFHGQKSLVGFSPWDRKELDTTERLTQLVHVFEAVSVKSLNNCWCQVS